MQNACLMIIAVCNTSYFISLQWVSLVSWKTSTTYTTHLLPSIIWQINTHDIKPDCSVGETGQRRWTLVHSVFVTSLKTPTGPPLPAGPARGGGGGGFDVEGESLGGPNADKTFFILFSLRTEGGLLASALILRRRLSSTITFQSCPAVRSQHKYRMKKYLKQFFSISKNILQNISCKHADTQWSLFWQLNETHIPRGSKWSLKCKS